MKNKKKPKHPRVKKNIPINRDLSTWDAQFKKAIAEKEPERSIWPIYVSETGDKDWNW